MVRRRRGLAPAPRARRVGWLASCAAVLGSAPPAHAQLVLDAAATLVSPGGQSPAIVQTARTADITLGAPRTVLNWSTFNLASDQAVVYRFGDRSWIVLNRVTGQAVLDGQIEAFVGNARGAGNVWFYAPGGVVIGSNARVNVGGLLATSGQVATAGFLDPSNFSFGFTGGGAGRVDVRAGAEVKSGGGPVALIAGAVTTAGGAAVTGTGRSSVLYAAAGDYTVRFAPQPGDLDLVDFVVPAGSGTASATPLTLAGQTAAGSVYLAVVNRADVASAVVSAPGLIAAQSASADRGDVILAAGAGISNRQPGATRVNTTTETTATFGVVTATRDLLGGFAAPTAMTATQLSAGRDLGLAAASVDTSGLDAGRLLAVDAARSLTVRASASAGAAATLRTTGALNVAGAVNAVGRLQIDAGSVQAARLNSGRSVVVNASGAAANGGPAVSVNAALAADDILITTTGAAGSIVLGEARLTGAGADEGPAGRSLILRTGGASADITFGAVSGSPLAGASNAAFAGGRDVTVSVPGLLTLAPSSAGRTFTIRASDLELTGTLTAANLRIESLQGAMTLGGAAGGAAGAPAADMPGLRLTDAEFQQIAVTGEASFYAGSTASDARGDLVVQDLNVTPGRTPRLLFAAGGQNDVVIPGTLAPGITGGIVNIGEAAVDSPWRPGRILVTGAVGFSRGSPDAGYSDVRAFDEVNFNARNDVLIGAPRFISLVASAPPSSIDIVRNLPVGVAPTPEEENLVFVTAAELSLRAADRIVQQNTGTMQRPNGILVTTLLPGSLSAARASVVDLSGAFRDANGVVRGGSLSVEGGGSGIIRFNGCDAGQGGCGPLAVAAFTNRIIDSSGLGALKTGSGRSTDGVDPATAGLGGVPPEPPVLVFTDPNAEADAIATDPVTLGAGSAEVWRQKRQRPGR